MKDPTTPPTHMAWAQYRQRGKFVRWYQIGQGRIFRDPSGKTVACVAEQCIPRGHSGYTWLLPIGETPPDPPADDPRRPGQFPDAEDDS